MSDTKTVISGERLKEIFQAQNWSKLWTILQAHTVHRLRYRYGVKGSTDALRSRSREIIVDVLNLVFIEETRKWNSDAYLNINDFLVSVIDSFISNSFKTKTKEIPSTNDFIFDNSNGSAVSVEENITSQELRAQITCELTELGADDDELLVFECLLDGIEKPEEIRRELGISEEDFHNIWRRVKRKREKLKIKLSRYGY